MPPNPNTESWDTTDIPTGDKYHGTDRSIVTEQPGYESLPPPGSDGMGFTAFTWAFY